MISFVSVWVMLNLHAAPPDDDRIDEIFNDALLIEFRDERAEYFKSKLTGTERDWMVEHYTWLRNGSAGDGPAIEYYDECLELLLEEIKRRKTGVGRWIN